MDKAIKQAISKVVDYSWQAEERDFGEQDASGQRNHIFIELLFLRRWLESDS